MRDQAGTWQARFAHVDDAAAADFQTGMTHATERIEAVLIFTRRNDVIVKLRRGIPVVVVVIESGFFQAIDLALFQHAERGAGFQPERLDFAHHLFDLLHVTFFRRTSGGAHAKARRAVGLAPILFTYHSG